MDNNKNFKLKEVSKILNLLKNNSFPVDFSDELLFLFKERKSVNNVEIYWNIKAQNVEIKKNNKIKNKENNFETNRILIWSCNFKEFLEKEKIEELFSCIEDLYEGDAIFFVFTSAKSPLPLFAKEGWYKVQPDNIIYILTRGHRLHFSRKLIIKIPSPLEIDDALDRDRCDATACTFLKCVAKPTLY